MNGGVFAMRNGEPDGAGGCDTPYTIAAGLRGPSAPEANSAPGLVAISPEPSSRGGSILRYRPLAVYDAARQDDGEQATESCRARNWRHREAGGAGYRLAKNRCRETGLMTRRCSP